MLTLILSVNPRLGRREILRRISADVAQKLPGRILMVPELVSHETERALCEFAGDTASRYAEVMSFTGLQRRVSEEAGAFAQTLDAGGRVVAMAACARQLSSRLKAYAGVESRPEFLKDLIDAVDEFKRCCITPADLALAAAKTEGAFAQKLEELSLLMESYDALCARGKRDPRDAMVWLQEQLEEGSFAAAHSFYIDGFPDFTRQHLAILETIMVYTPDLTVCLNCDGVDSKALAFEKAGTTARLLYAAAKRFGVEVKVEVLADTADGLAPVRAGLYQGRICKGSARGFLRTIRADSQWNACLLAAEEIRRLAASGVRYREISLVYGLTDYSSTMNLVAQRMHIPLYQSGTEDILRKSVIATVLASLDVAASDYEGKAMVQYLRSGLSPLTFDEADRVENYLLLWNIRGKAWLSPWEKHPDGLSAEWDDASREELMRLNSLRSLVIEPLETLRRGLDGAKSIREQVLALYAFLENIHLAQRLEEMAETLQNRGEGREAQILNQLWDILVGALEQMYDMLGDTHWETEHFGRLLRLLLSRYDVGTIPPVLDAVSFGPVTALHCHEARYTLVLGVQEGSMPGYSGSVGLLSDRERNALRALGVPLTGGAMEGISSEFAEIYGVFSGAEKTIWACCDGEPSFLFRRLSELSGEEEQGKPALGYAGADRVEAAFALASREDAAAAKALGLESLYTEALFRKNYSLGALSSEAITSLYGKELKLSASQIDTQADCRRRYFLQYGLKAKERKPADVDPTEFGTFVHSVLEDTARTVMEKGGFHQVSLSDTLTIAHGYADSYIENHFGALDSGRIGYLFRRNRRELDMVVEDLWQELSRSEFAPIGFEVGFDKGEELPPIEIPSDTLHAILRGFVDRVDLWKLPSGGYYRIVDYKTGKKDFDYCDVYNGIGLQMLLYLFALRRQGKAFLGEGCIGAGIQYFPARAPFLSTDGKLTQEQAQAARADALVRKGLLLADKDVLQAMEPGESPVYLDVSYKKDGSLSGDIATREQMKLLESYVFSLLSRLVADIGSGSTQPNPYTRGSSHNACNFCPYTPICRGTQEQGRRNYKTMTARRFWEELSGEVERHG